MTDLERLERMQALAKEFDRIVDGELKHGPFELRASIVMTAMIESLAMMIVSTSFAVGEGAPLDFDHIDEGVTQCAQQLRSFAHVKFETMKSLGR